MRSNYLKNPQGFNSYSYTINNPIKLVDTEGEWFKEFFTGQQSWSSFVIEIGDAGETLYDTSAVGRTVMDYPYSSGAAIGAGSGLIAYGASAGITYGLAEIGIIGSTAGTQANKVIDYTQKYGQNLGARMNQVSKSLQNSGYNFSNHSIKRIAERIGVGNEKSVLNVLQNSKSFEYFHDGVQKIGRYDSTTKMFIGQVKDSGNIITIITNASKNVSAILLNN